MASTNAASAQSLSLGHDPESFINRQRVIEEELRKQFDAEVAASRWTRLDWGGWYSFHVFVFDDGVESSRTFRRHDLRLWTRWTAEEGAHEIYVRGRLSLLDFNTSDSYDGDDDDTEGMNLERGYYRFDLAKAAKAGNDRPIDYNLVLTAGRDLVRFGNGLALATPLDHMSLVGTSGHFEITGLIGRTVGSTQDFDLSRTAERTRRSIFGVQTRYLGWERQEPFAYAFWQRDHNREAVWNPLQEYDYDSFYFGVGSHGELVQRLRYETEWVYESGHGYGDRRFLNQDYISAWAYQAELEYLFPGPKQARASIEYLFGSGDPDRLGSPTNTVNGNRFDYKDSSFIGLGYHDTGLSLAPRYSNLHMGRAGASFYPWPQNERLKKLEIGTDWYLFHKHHHSAAVSDPTADVGSGYLGWEMDYFANWEVTTDLSWTARFGAFFPGRSFDDRTTRTFLLVGFTLSF